MAESAATDAVGIYHHKGIIYYVNLNSPNSVPTPRHDYSYKTDTTTSSDSVKCFLQYFYR